jgi:molecular chaperone DnaJ
MPHRSTAIRTDVEINDPYGELGLTAQATDTEVKAAWRRLSARWHPDRNASPHAIHRIQRINRALDEIRSVRGRSDHDSGASAGGADTEAGDEQPFDHGISLTIEEAACGCVRDVQGEIARECEACCASGVGPEPVACDRCGGAGHVRQNIWFPWLASSAPCGACGGAGATRVACLVCSGSGQAAPRRYKSRIRIPAGVRDGHVLQARVRVQGDEAKQALNVRIALEPHEFFVLQDDGTVKVEVPVDGFAWVAGRWIDVPTPYGVQHMRLQRGALTYRIRNHGFPEAPEAARADCLVTVVPLFPADFSARQEALLDKLIASNTGDASSEAGLRAKEWAGTLSGWPGRTQGR